MIRRSLLPVALLAALAVAPAAQATVTVKFVGAGSSAMWQATAIAAYKDLAGSGAHHYTVKGKCTSGNCAQLKDQRSSSIALEGGSLWVVWDSTASNVWAYLTVDSVVGNRAFFAAPRALLQIDAQTESTAGQNLISTALWGSDDPVLPAAVYAALNGHAVITAMTDIRPEDAKFAQVRAVSALNTTNYSGLGYGSGPSTLIGTPIQSAFTTATANPVAFNLSGVDPFTGQSIPAYKTISVGAAPVIYVVNRTNPNGLGFKVSGNFVFTTLSVANDQKLLTGTECDGNAFGASTPPPNFPVHVMLREPLSGTMNTNEFTNIRLTSNSFTLSQEKGVDPAAAGGNPLNLTCASGGGTRQRGIGTGEIISAVKANGDSLGYAFFSYGNVSKLAGSASYGYLMLSGVDPIFSSYTTGMLPTCTAPCPASPGTSFPNLRNGRYRSWSILRVVTDASGVNLTNTQALVTAAQNHVNSTVPDFVPALATTDGDPGLKLYRSHYFQSGIAPNNGLSGQTESGGDVGGCIEPVGPAPGVLGCRQ